MATVSTSTDTGSRRPLPRAERQAAIVHGAAIAFAASGYAGTSMDDVATASGITKLIVYRHFASKEDLYRAVLQRVFDRLTEEFVAAVATGATGIGARTLLTVAREDPVAFQLLWRHAAREPAFAEYAQELRDHAVDASRALLAGRVEPDAHEWAAQTVFSFLLDATLHWLEYGDASRDDEFVARTTAAVRGVVEGLAGPAGARRRTRA